MPSDLVELARFPSSAEASIVRGQLECEGIRAELTDEAAASWLWHLGTAIGGVRLLVNRDDADRAMGIIGSPIALDETLAIDFGDDSDDDGSELPEDLIRAWRAALIGLLLLPPLLNIYSTWLLLRHGLFVGRCRNWRILAACSVNAMVFALAILIVFQIADPPEPIANPPESPPQFFTLDGEPIDVEYEKEMITIPLVP